LHILGGLSLPLGKNVKSLNHTAFFSIDESTIHLLFSTGTACLSLRELRAGGPVTVILEFSFTTNC
jgi:hypothetical protein